MWKGSSISIPRDSKWLRIAKPQMPLSTKRHIYFGLLFLVSLVGIFCVYWLAFYVWRSAADPANNSVWHARILVWFDASIIVLLVWIADVIAFIRTYPGSRSPNKSSGIN